MAVADSFAPGVLVRGQLEQPSVAANWSLPGISGAKHFGDRRVSIS